MTIINEINEQKEIVENKNLLFQRTKEFWEVGGGRPKGSCLNTENYSKKKTVFALTNRGIVPI